MVSLDVYRKMALSFEDTDEHPHFHTKAFRVRKRIFTTLHTNDHRGMLILTPVEQSIYCDYDSSVFFPVPGGWGKKGCTFVDLKKVKITVFKEALTTAYNGIAAKYPVKKKKTTPASNKKS